MMGGKINLSKRPEQNFVNISFLNLKRKIGYIAECEGFPVIRKQEGPASKCSFINSEEITKHKKYLDRRVKGGVLRVFEVW